MSERVTILATLRFKPQCIEQARPHLKKLIEASRGEKGVVFYNSYEDVHNEGTFIFYEQYVDPAAAKAHQTSQHFKQTSKSFGKLLQGAPQIKIVRADNVAPAKL